MYDELAAYYHLIFENWDASIARQAGVLGPPIETACGKNPARILDAACGIGTQAVGLARRGHTVTGSDLSQTADNAFAHLPSEHDLRQAVASAARKLDRGGILLATMRNYDMLARERPTFHGPAFYEGDGGRRRIVHQVWDWTGERRYTMHLYITRETAAGWETHHFTAAFHAVPRAMVTGALEAAGFSAVRWMEPAESGYYQLIVLARLARLPSPACSPITP